MYAPSEREDFDSSELPIDVAILNQIERFTTCANYPRRDPTVVKLLARCLQRTCGQYGIRASELVDRIVKSTEFCPGEHEIIRTSQEMRDERWRRQEHERYQREMVEMKVKYGPPRPMPVFVPPVLERRCDAVWKAIRQQYPAADFRKLEWRSLAGMAREVGFGDIAAAWEKSLV